MRNKLVICIVVLGVFLVMTGRWLGLALLAAWVLAGVGLQKYL